jgi:hypothetical protein
MDVKINVKRRFKVNGVEYDSLEAMPPELRQAVERAAVGGGIHVSAGADAHIVFNGKRYGTREEMPEEDRSLYDAAMAALPETGSVPAGGSPEVADPESLSSRPIGPASGKSMAIRLLLLLAGVLLLWLGWVFLKGAR